MPTQSEPFTLRLPDDLEQIIGSARPSRPEGLTVACYTFPHYHRSALNDRLYGAGWTEYVLMHGCRPWFPGHHQPRTPLLGELDERDPATWVTYVDLAVEAGINAFIFDWYWYGGGPALHEAHEEGYLLARGRERTKFAVMWTNHPWAYWYPTGGLGPPEEWPEIRDPSGLGGFEIVDPGPKTAADVWRSLSYVVARYFHDPGYWHIDGKPFLSIWDVGLLIRTFGKDGTRQLFAELRAHARKLGHAGIHIHASQESLTVAAEFADLGIDSYGLYNSVIAGASRRPDDEQLPDFGAVAADVVADLWPEVDGYSPLPCFPCLSSGWDDTPRHIAHPPVDDAPRSVWPGGYIVVDETPAAFEAFARGALAYLNERPEIPPVILIGCWNEWTEGHYLLPDTRLGYGMLRALARGLDHGTAGTS